MKRINKLNSIVLGGLFASFFLLALLISALSDAAHQKMIIGKWQFTFAMANALYDGTFEFTSDGKEMITCKSTYKGQIVNATASGTYTISGKALTQNLTKIARTGIANTAPNQIPASVLRTGPFKLDGDHLTLNDPSSNKPYTLTRVK